MRVVPNGGRYSRDEILDQIFVQTPSHIVFTHSTFSALPVLLCGVRSLMISNGWGVSVLE